MDRQLTPSITHSVPAKSAPTLPKPLPLFHIPLPMSLKISFAFCPVFNPACVCCRNNGSSYANDADINEKNAPIARPGKTNSIYSGLSRGYHQIKKTKPHIPPAPAMIVLATQDSMANVIQSCVFFTCINWARSFSVKPGGRGSFPAGNIGASRGLEAIALGVLLSPPGVADKKLQRRSATRARKVHRFLFRLSK